MLFAHKTEAAAGSKGHATLVNQGKFRPAAVRRGSQTSPQTSLAPNVIAFDSYAGGIVVADPANHVVDLVNAQGQATVVAGVPGKSGAPTAGVATSSELENPSGLAVDPAGDIYASDAGANVVVKVTPDGTLSVIAGIPGTPGVPTLGPATSSRLFSPRGLALDSAGNLYIADSLDGTIDEVNGATGTLSVAAGVAGFIGAPTCGATQCAPRAPTQTYLYVPTAVAVDASDDIFVADTGNNIVEEDNASTGLMQPVLGISDQPGATVPGQAPLSTNLGHPTGLALDSSGDLFVADPADNDVIELSIASQTVTVVAGTGQGGAQTPGPANGSDLDEPSSIALDGSGNVYIGDTANYSIDEVDANGDLTVFAGDGTGVACPFQSPLTIPYQLATGTTIPSNASCVVAAGGQLQGAIQLSGGSLAIEQGGQVDGSILLAADSSTGRGSSLVASGGTVTGSITGEGTVNLSTTSVGNGIKLTGGSLDLENAIISRSVVASRTASLSIDGGRVKGSLSVTRSLPSTPVNPNTGTTICNVSIGDSLILHANRGAVSIGSCVGTVMVKNNLKATNNLGRVTVGGSQPVEVKDAVIVTDNKGGGSIGTTSATVSCTLAANNPAYQAIPDNTASQANNCNVNG